MRPIRLLLALLLVITALRPAHAGAGVRVAAGPERVPLAERGWFERYVTLDDLIDVAPDSARALAAHWRRERPGDVLGAHALAWLTLRGDSAATEAALTAGDRDTADAAATALAATLRMARRQSIPARQLYLRLARLHAAAGDHRAAAWDRLLRLLREAAPAEADADAEAALAHARRSGDAREAAEVALIVADRSGARLPAAHVRRLRAALAAGGAASQAARGEAQRRLGAALRASGRHAEAEAAYREAAALADSCGWIRLSLRAARGIASIVRARGRAAECLAMTRAFADSARALGFDEQYSEGLQDLGNAYLALGRLPEARAALEERLELIRQRRWHADQRMMTLDQLGGVAALEGRLDEARAHFDEALAIARRRRGHEFEPTVLLHIANLHRDMGDEPRALEVLAEGRAAAEAVGSRRTESMMLALEADILMDLGRLGESAALAARAAEHARAHEPRNLPMAWRTLSHTLVASGRAEAAQAPLDSLRAFLRGTSDTLQESQLERAEAEVALARGDTAAALSKTRLAVTLAEAVGSPDETASASLSLGQALQAAGRFAESIEPLERGIDYSERLAASSASRDERSRTRGRWQAYYGDMARGYHAIGRTADAFALLERSRARELRTQFGSLAAGAERHLPSDLASELRQREGELAALQQVLLEEWAKPVRERDAGLAGLEARADTLKRNWGDLQLRVQRAAPGFARASGLASPLTLTEVQARLGESEMLVAYMAGWHRLLRFDVTRGACRVHELPLTGSALSTRVRAWVSACQQSASEQWRRGAADLADTLLAGLDLPRGRVGTLLIVPDGALHTMPFEALLLREGTRRVALLERAEIVLAEAPGLLFAPEPPMRPNEAGSVVAFGDPLLAAGADPARERAATLAPLPHARLEVEGLRLAFPAATLHLGAEATEPRLHAALEGARIVHVAAHGFYDDRFPRFSALAMAPGERAGDPSSDGMMQAWEVLERRGDLELVTLSACETGRGRVVGGEGLDGLSRAFRIAGARQVVASLWRVDDAATAQLMRDFYRRLAAGASVRAALREARLALLRGGGAVTSGSRGIARTSERAVAAHPRVWAAFVLRGAR